jgi:glycosyltransferase involved in cell wall biosynthesis
MRILIVSDAWEPQVNGVVRTYQHIARELRDMGHDVIIIGPDSFKSVPMPGYNEIRLSWLPYRKLARLMREAHADSVHIAVEGPLGLAAQRWCRKHGVEYTTTYHTHFPDYMAGRVPFFKSAVRNAAIAFVRKFHARSRCVFVATQSLEDQLRAWGFAAPMKRMVRGVDFTVFHDAPGTLFTDAPRPVMLYVGRVSGEKNIEAFLALDALGTKVIVGHGPDFLYLQKKYPRAHFAGLQTGAALGEHYRSADVFVFPSKTDTFGMVLVEAMACGLPVAGYNVTGPRDIITEAKLGCVNDDLAAALSGALAAPGTRAERSCHARETYSWGAVAETFLEG